jgi:DNA-binding CsgD family transcriptional regulator
MDNKLRNSGFVFAAVFIAGYLLQLVMHLIKGDGLLVILFHPVQMMTLGSALVFLLSALFTPLRWFQPAVFLLTSPVNIIPEPTNIYGLGYFIVGTLLLERAGFFLKRRTAKVVALLAYLFAIEFAAAFWKKASFQAAISPTFFIAAFGLFLWFLYKDRLVVFLKEPKPELSLTKKGLAPSECSYIMALIQGKSPKEIALEFQVSDSTVRNTLVRAYKKLEVEDAQALVALTSTHEVVA